MKKFSLKFLKKSFSIHRNMEPHSITDKAERDWRLTLIVFAVLVVLVTIFNIYGFFRINDKDYFLDSNKEDLSNSTLDGERLDQILNYMKGKEAMLQGLIEEKPSVQDPSL